MTSCVATVQIDAQDGGQTLLPLQQLLYRVYVCLLESFDGDLKIAVA